MAGRFRTRHQPIVRGEICEVGRLRWSEPVLRRPVGVKSEVDGLVEEMVLLAAGRQVAGQHRVGVHEGDVDVVLAQVPGRFEL